MDPQSQARTMAMARVAFGIVFTVTPGVVLRAWVGRDHAATPAVRMLSRGLGARDLAIGVGALLALRHDAPARGWIEAGVVSDLGDALGIALAARHLPRFGAIGGLVAALGAAGAGRRVVTALAAADHSPPPA